MNLKFNKALYFLDRGDYEKGEENIIKAIEECEESSNKCELLQIKLCYAELLCALERFDEAMNAVNYILENTDEEFNNRERDTAISVKNYIEEVKNKWKVWTVRKDKVNYVLLAEEEKEWHKTDHIIVDGQRLIDKWDPSLELDVYEKTVEHSDVVLYDASFYCCNEKALSVFMDIVPNEIEVLDFVLKDIDEKYVIVNLLGSVDCVDMEKSEYKVYPGDHEKIQFFKKLCLKKDVIRNKDLYRIARCDETFHLCSDRFKEAIEKAGVTGLVFKLFAQDDGIGGSEYLCREASVWTSPIQAEYNIPDKTLVSKKKYSYRIKFHNALRLLDKGDYKRGEENIVKAIEECEESGNKYDLLQIKSYYAELLCALERFDKAMDVVNYILDNTDEELHSPERETAISVKNYIEIGDLEYPYYKASWTSPTKVEYKNGNSKTLRNKKVDSYRIKFQKALFLLDKGDYERGEENIVKAIEECEESSNKYELLQMKSCYAELLCKLERFDEAMNAVNYILENTDEEFHSPERETAISVKNYIENR